MPVTVVHKPGLADDQVVSEMAAQGFEAAAKAYDPGTTEPHAHDCDVCLYVVEGEFRLTEVDRSIVHRFGPGDRVLVDRGTIHAEDHGPLRMIVGRRAG
jgi:quercetin dioxygenase-like cupin family protein